MKEKERGREGGRRPVGERGAEHPTVFILRAAEGRHEKKALTTREQIDHDKREGLLFFSPKALRALQLLLVLSPSGDSLIRARLSSLSLALAPIESQPPVWFVMIQEHGLGEGTSQITSSSHIHTPATQACYQAI
jgi:hypothetical protein